MKKWASGRRSFVLNLRKKLGLGSLMLWQIMTDEIKQFKADVGDGKLYHGVLIVDLQLEKKPQRTFEYVGSVEQAVQSCTFANAIKLNVHWPDLTGISVITDMCLRKSLHTVHDHALL